MDSELHHSIPFLVKHKITIVLSGIVLGVFVHLVSSGDTAIQEGSNLLFQYVLVGCLGMIITFLISILSKWMNGLFSWREKPGRRFLLGLFINILLVFVLIKLADYFWLSDYPFYVTKLYLLSFIALVVYSVIHFALYSYHTYTVGQLNDIKIVSEQIDLQYAALRSQLSPHFLFNGLNTISALIHEDKGRAKSFIRSLAGCYDFVLDNYQSPLISVQEELTFVESYVFLLRTRFENNIDLIVDLPATVLKSPVPPLAIQMLVENATKHNLVSEKQKLEIRISSKEDHIVVSNNKTETPSKVSSFKIGLKNIFSRYKLLGYESHTLENETDFSVHLPIITRA